MDVNKLLSKFLGNKADRDMREIQPMVNRVFGVYDKIASLNNDQLREKSAELKKRVNAFPLA